MREDGDAPLLRLLMAELAVMHPAATERRREHFGRRLVAICRRGRGEFRTWGPGEPVPADVTAVIDLYGMGWTRTGERGGWVIATADPDDTESGREHTTDRLISRRGPVTRAATT